MRKLVIALLASLFINQLNAIPPDPPMGQRWVLNEAFSDEFNGTELDDSKWYGYHPQWKGRPPALFVKDAVTVKDGYMQIRNYKMKKDTVIWNWNHTDTDTFNIAGGAVRSKSNQAFFGYYECRFKASKTSMSTTFWLSSDHTVKIPACATGKEKYGLELDIQECVGRVDVSSKEWFTTGMNSNTHFHYTNCDGVKETRSKGAGIDSDVPNADVFNTYAAWWKNENEVDYVFNDSETKNVKFRTDILEKPFNFPMAMNMVTETYDWISTPRAENLNDDTKNTSYYDWVRSYELVDVDAGDQIENLIANGDFETGTLSGWEGWGGSPREIDNTQAYEGQYCVHIGGAGAPEQVLNLKPNTAYTLTAYAKAVKGTVTLGVKNNESGVHFEEAKVSETDYQKYTVNFTTDEGTSIKVFYYAPSANDEGYIDKLILVEDGASSGIETVMFNEDVNFAKKPAILNNASPFDFITVYKSNANRELVLAILDASDQVIAEDVYSALGGFGKKGLALSMGDVLQEGINYKAKIHIRPLNSDDNSAAYASDEFTFGVSNPKTVSITLINKITALPIIGAEVNFNGTMLTSNESGIVTFQDVPVMQHTLNLAVDGYSPKQNIQLDIQEDAALTYEMEPSLYNISIFVKDSVSQLPIEGARIFIGTVSRKTDSNGKVNYNLYFGENPIEISHSQYGSKSDTLLTNNDDAAMVLLSRKVTDVSVKVQLDNSALGYADVTMGEQSKKTAFNGQISFSDVPTNVPIQYSVTYQEKLWLEETAEFYNDTLVSIELSSTALNDVSKHQIKVFPNPVKSELHLHGLSVPCNFTVSQINGVSLMNGSVKPNETIQLGKLKNGMYILSLGEEINIPFVKQ